ARTPRPRLFPYTTLFRSLGIRTTAGVVIDITASQNNTVKSSPIYNQVFNRRKSFRSPGLYGDLVAILEGSHMKLARSSLLGTLRLAIDVQRTSTAYSFPTIVIKMYRILPF